jgi:hypothetical protein
MAIPRHTEPSVSSLAAHSPVAHAADPDALALAAALQAALPDAQVVLFGSRAMGDWQPESDIDLAVIGGDRDAAEETLAQLPFRTKGVQLFHFTAVEFAALRTSRPHLAGQVQAHGRTANGGQLSPMRQLNPWPGVQNYLHSARRRLETALILYGTQPQSGDIVLAAHGTLERCVKAALAATGVDFREHLPRDDQHSVVALAGLLAARTPADPTDLIPATLLHELDSFHGTSLYGHDSALDWPATEMPDLLAAVRRTSLALVDHALTKLGKSADAIGYEHRIGGDALGGFGTVALDHYGGAQLNARERQLLITNERIGTFKVLVGNHLSASQVEQVEANWYAHNAPDDAAARIGTVMHDPAAWRSLLVRADYRESDDRPPPKGV